MARAPKGRASSVGGASTEVSIAATLACASAIACVSVLGASTSVCRVSPRAGAGAARPLLTISRAREASATSSAKAGNEASRSSTTGTDPVRITA